MFQNPDIEYYSHFQFKIPKTRIFDFWKIWIFTIIVKHNILLLYCVELPDLVQMVEKMNVTNTVHNVFILYQIFCDFLSTANTVFCQTRITIIHDRNYHN